MSLLGSIAAGVGNLILAVVAFVFGFLMLIAGSAERSAVLQIFGAVVCGAVLARAFGLI